jgi:hypothetical protein
LGVRGQGVGVFVVRGLWVRVQGLVVRVWGSNEHGRSSENTPPPPTGGEVWGLGRRA